MSLLDQPIFVTGLPRSGTSLVAGCLSRCGAWVGQTVPGGVGNPRGFYENIRIREQLVKPILTALGCDPLGVKKLPLIEGIPNAEGLYESLNIILSAERYDASQRWLYKDAKLTLLWPYFYKVFPLATWVIVRRREDDIVDSCMRTHFMAHHSQNRAFWCSFVAEYQQRLLQLTNSGAKVFEFHADNLISSDSTEFAQLAETLGLNFCPQSVHEFISPSLWRNQSQIDSLAKSSGCDDSTTSARFTRMR